MRDRPVPNRHAYDLSLFFECVQAALNRNREKPGLNSMGPIELVAKLEEEWMELDHEIMQADLDEYQGRNPAYEKVEREAADLAICALAAFIWARGLGAGK